MRAFNKQVTEDTIKYVEWYYQDKLDEIEKTRKMTVVYKNFIERPKIDSKRKTEIIVVNDDTLNCVQDMILDNMVSNPLVLNMASWRRPGGGWRSGANAQEEDLFRRSDYYLYLEDKNIMDLYPLGMKMSIYTPRVFVFKGGAPNYDIYKKKSRFSASFLAMAAISNPKLIKERLSLKDEQLTLSKIRHIFNVALENKHDSLVLGALGCGAYNNPPQHIAELFKKVIAEYDGVFQTIVFPVLSFKSNPNFSIFKSVLSHKI